MRPKTKVSVSVSIFETTFIKSQSQSQNLIPILKVSVSVSKIETGHTESKSQSHYAKNGLAHPWNRVTHKEGQNQAQFFWTEPHIPTERCSRAKRKSYSYSKTFPNFGTEAVKNSSISVTNISKIIFRKAPLKVVFHQRSFFHSKLSSLKNGLFPLHRGCTVYSTYYIPKL